MCKRTLSIGGAVCLLILSLVACGGSGTSSAHREATQRQADLYAIDQIEKTWHRATSTHYVELNTRRLVAVTGADQQVARIGGRWLITNNVGGTPTLAAPPRARKH